LSSFVLSFVNRGGIEVQPQQEKRRELPLPFAFSLFLFLFTQQHPITPNQKSLFSGEEEQRDVKKQSKKAFAFFPTTKTTQRYRIAQLPNSSAQYCTARLPTDHQVFFFFLPHKEEEEKHL